MTLYLRDQENQEIGMERGLKIGLEQGLVVLINSLKEFIPEEEALYQAIIKNEAYKDTSRETVQKYFR